MRFQAQQATRLTRRDALPHDIAAGLIQTWLRFKVEISVNQYASGDGRLADCELGREVIGLILGLVL